VPEKSSAPDDGRLGVVLLAEDDPDAAAYTGMVLRRLAGARVLDVASADAALTVLAVEDVDVVVTDIDLLPGADGLELTARGSARPSRSTCARATPSRCSRSPAVRRAARRTPARASRPRRPR
jgi:CheY-like chemotaxis protein